MAKAKKRKLTWGAGTIFKRGATYYFENKAKGVTMKSLRTGNEADAMDEARRRFGHLEEKTEQGQRSRLLATYEDTDKMLRERKRKRIPIAKAFDEYEKRLKLHSKTGRRHVEAGDKMPVAPKTLKMTKSIIGTFGKWLGDDHADIVNVDDVTPQIAEAYFLACRDTYKASSFNRHLAGLRGVWDTLQIAAGIDSNPFRLVKQIRKAEVDNETASKRDFSLDELRTMDEHATGWIRPGMFISFFTGLRLSDVVCLRWDEADIDGGFISIVSRKTSKPIVIYAPEAMSHLRAWRDSQDETGEYVFQRMASAYLGIGRGEDRTIATKEFQRFLAETCGFDTKARIYNISGDVLEALRGRKLPAKMCAAIESIRNRQMTDSPGLMTFTDALNKTGISKKHQDVIRAAAFVTDQTILGFHSLRVAHATYANRTGQSREDIQKRLQHSQSTTTDGYIKETTDEVRQKLIEDHVALSFAGEPVNRNGNGKTRDRISELVESMNAKNWKKVKTEILATLEI